MIVAAKPKRYTVDAMSSHPDGYNDQLLYEGRSLWQAWRAWRSARRNGMDVRTFYVHGRRAEFVYTVNVVKSAQVG